MQASEALQVPLRPMSRTAAGDAEDPVTVDDLQSYMCSVQDAPLPNSCKVRWLTRINYASLAVVVAALLWVVILLTRLILANFEVIWGNGFVAALFLGGLAFAVRALAQWVAINVFARFFLTTIKLSKDTKEATPVLEWFKVWLPKMMKDRGSAFRSIQPLFRKKDGSTFFSFLRDIRNRDKFELVSWVMPGTHFFRYRSERLGGSVDVWMIYWTGEAKKEGWDQTLTVMENVLLTVFDPFGQAMPILLEMLSEAQERFAERDLDCLRFQEWHGWKQMWESATPDERIAPNFKALAFYPQELLKSVESEVEQFLNTPPETLLRAGLPLKLGFLFHGPPGTGKTNLVRYLAAKYRLPINVVDCNSGHMDNGQLLHAVVSAEGIVLMEDIDNLDAACGRVRESGISLQQGKAEMSKRVTLDGLLNALDGVHRGTQKRILIATTNYVDKLIPSIRRRGRFGISYRVDYPQDQEFTDILNYYLPQVPKDKILHGVRSLEQRTGLRLATAAAVDIIGKLGLSLAANHCVDQQVLVKSLLNQIEYSLQELQQSNRKQLMGTHQLLTLLGLQTYAADFLRGGLVDLRYVKLLNDGELEKVGVKRLGDRKKLLDAFQYMDDSPPLEGPALEKAKTGLIQLCGTEPVIFKDLAQLLTAALGDSSDRAEIEAKFKEQGMAGCSLQELKRLEAGDLEKLGLDKLGDRKRFLRFVEQLEEE